MKRFTTAQVGEVATDLACRVSTLAERFHTLKVDAQSTEVIRSQRLICSASTRVTRQKSIDRERRDKLFGAQCFVGRVS